jgi:hypothetical protein
MIHNTNNYNKIYSVNKLNINDLKFVLTGEVDCIENNGNRIELTTKPSFAKFDKDRLLTNWIQSSLSDTQTIVTGKWKGARNCPVTFLKPDITFENIEDYSKCLSNKNKSGAYDYAYEIFTKIKSNCTKDNVVYNVTNDGISGDIIIKECNVNEFIFPINHEVINSCAAACISISNDKEVKEEIKLNDKEL